MVAEGMQQAPHGNGGGHSPLVGEPLVVALELVQLAGVVHHRPGATAQPLLGAVSQEATALQPGAVAPVEAGDGLGRQAPAVAGLHSVAKVYRRGNPAVSSWTTCLSMPFWHEG